MSQKTYGMNPGEVRSEGKKLQDNAGSFATELQKLVRYNSALEQIWKGSGSETYFTKWNEKKMSIEKLQKWLSGFANATVSSAEQAQRTDTDVSGMMK